MFPRILITVLITVNCISVRSQYTCSSCPYECACTQWNDISGCIVDCTLGNLDEVPTLESTNTVKFNMSSNHLRYLTQEDFGLSLSRMKYLDLSKNLIETIEQNTFKYLETLEILNLCDNNLRIVPDGLPLSLRVLNLNSNNIHSLDLGFMTGQSVENLESLYFDNNEIEEMHFDSNVILNSFSNLQELSLMNNKISSVTILAFSGFTKLKFLSLSTNLLDEIPINLFHYNSEIEVIDLSNNQIKHIRPGLFKNLSKLKFLNLSGNRIKKFPVDIPLLEWFDLSYNNITKIPEQSKPGVYPCEVLLLGGNPFHCDCNLLWLKEFYDSREYKLSYINVEKEKFIPTCATPQVMINETWDLLSSDMFQCTVPENQLNSGEESHPVQMRVTEVRSHDILLYWDQYKRPSSVILSFHRSGQKQMETKISIQPSSDLRSTFTLKELEPNTTYIICLNIEFAVNSDHSLTHSGCLQVRTMEVTSYFQVILNEGLQYSDVLMLSILCVIIGYWMHRLFEIRHSN